jgi:catechol 2,3-dioxygenase-like lactoylglutathione lyase family enzyme
MPAISGASHVAFTVTDVVRSSAWYCELLGLRQYHAGPNEHFDEFRTGLDHFAFQAADRAELEAWQAEFRRRGIPYSPIVDTPHCIGDRLPRSRWHPARTLASVRVT